MIKQLATLTRLLATAGITLTGLTLAASHPTASRRPVGGPLRTWIGRRGERGSYTAETVIVAAVLAAAAITVGGIIVAKVVARAHSISL